MANIIGEGTQLEKLEEVEKAIPQPSKRILPDLLIIEKLQFY